MRRRQAGNYKGKAVYVIGGLALCSIIGLLGIYAYEINQAPKQPDVVDLNEVADSSEKTVTKPKTDETEKNESTENEDNESTLSKKESKEKATKQNTDATTSSDMDSENEQESTESAQTDPPKSEPETQETSANASSVSFSEGETLTWPVSGNILMNYSMDATVYFATLDQYKYNPALIIESSVNTNVLSATDGIVEAITTNEETGLTMTVNLGNGYKAIYGQLKENQMNEGDLIDKGAIIGFINEPTKYYSTEGANLYFKLTKDDQPINPANYME